MKRKLTILFTAYPCFILLNLICLSLGNILFNKSPFTNFIMIGRFCKIDNQTFQIYNVVIVAIKLIFCVMMAILFRYYKQTQATLFLSVILFMSSFGILQEIIRALGISPFEFNYFFSDKECYSVSSFMFWGHTFILPLIYCLIGILLYVNKKNMFDTKQGFLICFIILPFLSSVLYMLTLKLIYF